MMYKGTLRSTFVFVAVMALCAMLAMPVAAETPPATPKGVKVYKFVGVLVVEKVYKTKQSQALVQFQAYYEGDYKGERWLVLAEHKVTEQSYAATVIARRADGKIYKVGEIRFEIDKNNQPGKLKIDVYEGKTLTQTHVRRAEATWKKYAQETNAEKLHEYWLKHLDQVPDDFPTLPIP